MFAQAESRLFQNATNFCGILIKFWQNPTTINSESVAFLGNYLFGLKFTFSKRKTHVYKIIDYRCFKYFKIEVGFSSGIRIFTQLGRNARHHFFSNKRPTDRYSSGKCRALNVDHVETAQMICQRWNDECGNGTWRHR